MAYEPQPRPTLNTLDDVLALKFHGNFHGDSLVFQAIDDFAILTARNADEARAALNFMGRVGMGLDDDLSHAEFLTWLDECGRSPVHYDAR